MRALARSATAATFWEPERTLVPLRRPPPQQRSAGCQSRSPLRRSRLPRLHAIRMRALSEYSITSAHCKFEALGIARGGHVMSQTLRG